MKNYLVGGAVRDMIMGLPVKDFDFVVVGSSPEEMIAAGFSQVGADFPVFLHPETKDEYALARIERKSGNGYHGFETDFSKEVSLEDDLKRRDLTMNAIAYSDVEGFFDPFNGKRDIQDKVIRHVSDAFGEDPVRVLRVARFAARYDDFTIAPETVELCRQMVVNGELNHLTPERVAAEMTKALMEHKASKFFYTLQEFGALEVLFPELFALIGQTQPEKYHAEGDSFVHTMMVLDMATVAGYDLIIRFCALTHDLGKGLTPKHLLPHHKGHEAAGVPVVEAMCDRLKLPSDFKRAGKKSARFHMHLHKFHELKDSTVVKLFNEMGGRSNPDDFLTLAKVALCDHHGRRKGDGSSNGQHPNVHTFMFCMNALMAVKLSNFKSPEEIKAMSVGQIQSLIATEQRRAVNRVRKEVAES